MKAWMIPSFLALHYLASPAYGVESDVSVEEFLQNLSSVKDVVSRKDPFIQAEPPFNDLEDPNSLVTAPVLERYSTNQYEIVATLLGDQYPRALVRVPESNKVLIVKQNDKLGNRGGIIKKILPAEVVVLQNHKSEHGFSEKVEIVLKVGVAAKSLDAPSIR